MRVAGAGSTGRDPDAGGKRRTPAAEDDGAEPGGAGGVRGLRVTLQRQRVSAGRRARDRVTCPTRCTVRVSGRLAGRRGSALVRATRPRRLRAGRPTTLRVRLTPAATRWLERRTRSRRRVGLALRVRVTVGSRTTIVRRTAALRPRR